MELYENTRPIKYRNARGSEIQTPTEKKHGTPRGVRNAIIVMAVMIALMLAAIIFGMIMITQEQEQIREIRNIQKSLLAQLNDTEYSGTSLTRKQDARTASPEQTFSAMNASLQQPRRKLEQEYSSGTSLARKQDARIVSLEQNLSAMNASLQQARQKLGQENSDTSLARKQDARIVSLEQNLSTMNSSLQQARQKLVHSVTSQAQKQDARIFSLEQYLSTMNASLQQARQTLGQVYSVTSIARKQGVRIFSLEQVLSTMNASLQQARQTLGQVYSVTSIARKQGARILSVEEFLSTMNASLQQARQTVGHVESDSDHLKKVLRVVACSIWYKDKCFLPIKPAINHTSASELCKEFGGGLANIYSKPHMRLIMDSIRLTNLNGLAVVNFHVGMNVVPSTGSRSMTLSDGKSAPPLPWYPGYPRNEPSRTSLALRVHRDSSSTNQYLWNIQPQDREFVLCEMG